MRLDQYHIAPRLTQQGRALGLDHLLDMRVNACEIGRTFPTAFPKNSGRFANFIKPLILLVPLAGLEPARCHHHLILSQARLPIPP
jgi:hypothetical protein